MRPTRKAFDFETDLHGVRVVLAKEPMSAAAWTDGEIDWQIQALKNDLDDLAPKMKAAAKRQLEQSPFGASDATRT